MANFSVDGIISGLKTGDIISQLMAIEKQPLDRLNQQKSAQDAKAQAMQGIKSLVATLRSVVFKLTQRGQINSRVATSDSSAVGAKAGTGALNGTFHVNVSQLATATAVTSS